MAGCILLKGRRISALHPEEQSDEGSITNEKSIMKNSELWISSKKFSRERATIEKMAAIFCYGRHGQLSLCPSCSELFNYSIERLKRCPHGPAKPRCATCKIHCYQKDMRARMKEVMKYSGPRMLYRHPWLTLMHYTK